MSDPLKIFEPPKIISNTTSSLVLKKVTRFDAKLYHDIFSFKGIINILFANGGSLIANQLLFRSVIAKPKLVNIIYYQANLNVKIQDIFRIEVYQPKKEHGELLFYILPQKEWTLETLYAAFKKAIVELKERKLKAHRVVRKIEKRKANVKTTQQLFEKLEKT